MTTKRLSPTAALLRSSRLFSLPPPLPPPAATLTSTTVVGSDTATLPYPVYAAVATAPSSLSRGDWGLKRPLPLRSTTKTSTPAIRVETADSLEHITDFASASDHTLTLKKWQELHLPLSAVQGRRLSASGYAGTNPSRSVFENELDRTHREERGMFHAAQRWKFAGPWLAGKTEGEFQRYLSKEIRGRKQEFRQYVRRHIAARKAAEQRRMAMEQGESVASLASGDQAIIVSDEELEAYLRSLRHEPSMLNDLIHNFLDLPASPSLGRSGRASNIFDTNTADMSSAAMYADTGPPKMHPSGGLSYLRTDAYVANHPVLGPQAQPPPVPARVLHPRRSATGQARVAKLGIAGVVADYSTPPTFKSAQDDGSGLSGLRPEISGGGKLWVHPVRASMDAQGRISLQAAQAMPTTVAVHEGTIQDPATTTDHTQPGPPLTGSRDAHGSGRSSSARSYGYGIEGGSASKRPSPFADPSRPTAEGHEKSFQEIEEMLLKRG
ncbi:MAG: hypothetical protein M1838_003607 [Thelocarpon superellum]|nr:MAG: hypothetical protein M1838_003607 [Thelocarpon superellum]